MRFWPYNRKKRQDTDKRELPVVSKTAESYLSFVQLPEPCRTGGMPLAEALGNRRSVREISKDPISEQQISDLLWAACGLSLRKDLGHCVKYLFTNPTASNHQEVSIYLFSRTGVFLYDSKHHALLKIMKSDKRKSLSRLRFVRKATLSLCLVSDIDKMVRHSDNFRQQLYSSMDAGYVSQNIYLHCTANGLATCACGIIEREKIAKLLGLTNARVMLVHPIGIRK